MAIVIMSGGSTRFLELGGGFGGAVYISYNFRAVGWLGGCLVDWVSGVGVGDFFIQKLLLIEILLYSTGRLFVSCCLWHNITQ